MGADVPVTVLLLFGCRDNQQTNEASKKKIVAWKKKKKEARNNLIVFVRTTEMPFVIESGKRTKEETNFRLSLFLLLYLHSLLR